MRCSQLPTAASWRNGRGAAVCGQHGVLQRVGGVVGAAAGAAGQPVQLAVVAVEQLLERVPVTGDVRRQQLGVDCAGAGPSVLRIAERYRDSRRGTSCGPSLPEPGVDLTDRSICGARLGIVAPSGCGFER